VGNLYNCIKGGNNLRILLLSDTHYRSTSPVGRIDDFRKAQRNKWRRVRKAAEENAVDYVLQAGDLWNMPNPPIELIKEFLVVANFGTPLLTILGQHDMYMRSLSLDNTANGLLQHLGIVKILSETGFYEQSTFIAGVSYGGDLEKARDALRASKASYKILVIHAMIGDKPLYPGHDITKASGFLKKVKEADLILTGDYHYPYYHEHEGRVILNTGCLMRMTRDDRDMNRRPHYYILNTITRKLKKKFIKAESPEKVFEPKTEQTSLRIDTFEMIEQLKKSHKVGLSFTENLEAYYEKFTSTKPVKSLVRKALSMGGYKP